MFQIWRYRTSWQEISTPLHHDSRFFLTFFGSNGIWSNKIWTGSWLASVGPAWHERAAHICSVVSLQQTHDKLMTTWQLRRTFPWSGQCLLPWSVLRIFPHNVCSAPAPQISQLCVSVRATYTIYSGLNTRTSWVAQEPVSSVSISIPLPPQQ